MLLRLFVLFFASLPFLNGLDLSVTKGREKEVDFSTLTLTDEKPFACVYKTYPAEEIICTIDSTPKVGFMPFKTDFFEVSYEIKNFIFHLHIKPKFQEALFALPYDYKQSIPIQKLKLKNSKVWQVVGFHHKIPFLTPKDYNAPSNEGLNFPILIEGAQTPIIQELDVDNKPLTYTKGQDLEEYLGLKQLIKNGYYLEALEAIARIFRLYPRTIFKKDLYFYEIIALSKLKKRQELTIQVASQWLKFYPSDPQVPYVLYMLGNTYSQINYTAQATEKYNRIMDEYPNNRYASLAQMHLAEQAANGGDRSGASTLFQKAYSTAKDIESASQIAFNWGLFDLNGGGKNATLILNKIIYGNPEYFMQHPVKSYELLVALKTHSFFDPAIKIATLLSHQDNDKTIQEKAAFELGLLYAKNNQPNEAHFANLEYLDNYTNMIHITLVKSRDEQVLFAMHGDYREKLNRYNQVLKDYPKTSKEYQKALEYKAELLLDRHYYAQVLELNLPHNSPAMREALLQQGHLALKEADCKSFNTYLVRMEKIDPHAFDDEEQVEAFDCLYDSALYNKAGIFSTSALKDKPMNKLPWLYRQGRNLYALNDFANSLLAAKDALALASLSKESTYYDIAFTVFLDYMKTNNPQEAFKVYNQLQKEFKEDERMIEVYALLLQSEQRGKNNPTTLELYAKNLIALQKHYENNSYTPYAQNELISALSREGKIEEALKQSDALLALQIAPKERQRALYNKATLLRQKGDKGGAKKTFQTCVAIKDSSPWKDLCQQALELFK
ncbi:Paralysed flagella protein PlfA [Helicobacter sp. NHP19-003]|uniref:Paralysed flagella protein PlfA n=1 Tax=Helicobacter gastrocanis TaxID=2849641 RepID=A0ABM7S917_9HELI|nr:outer membrane protein assembly factor BamD [Helicobacter sp. NHP19-003]BCZ17000.1 Paralysed flagella protein PlfA [Helicobacter sp. NHP19-003]